MTYPSWYQQACAVIVRAMDQGIAEGLKGKDLVKVVDAAYPFGPRENFPYKMWLKARRELLFGARKFHARDKAIPSAPGQGSLFGDGGGS